MGELPNMSCAANQRLPWRRRAASLARAKYALCAATPVAPEWDDTPEGHPCPALGERAHELFERSGDETVVVVKEMDEQRAREPRGLVADEPRMAPRGTGTRHIAHTRVADRFDGPPRRPLPAVVDDDDPVETPR